VRVERAFAAGAREDRERVATGRLVERVEPEGFHRDTPYPGIAPPAKLVRARADVYPRVVRTPTDERDPIPTAEDSWERHIRILDLLKQVRARRAALRSPAGATPSAEGTRRSPRARA
jgi:hypothetical protein